MAKEAQGVIAYIATSTVVSTAIKLGEVTGFSGPSMTAAVIDVTTLESTAKEKLIGLYDGGQITFNLNCLVTDSGQTKARESMVQRTKCSVLVQLSTAATTQKIGLEGYVSALSFAGSVDNKLSGDMTFAISGGASFST